MPSVLPIINTVWIGDQLGPLHRGCIRSFLKQGHRVLLHAWGRPRDVPDGVELVDAENFMARSEIISHKQTGSFALASDIYRYRILKKGFGLYVDCDVYCLRPFYDSDFIFGWESNFTINGAVLCIPKDNAILNELIEASSDSYFIPWWFGSRKRQKLKIRKALGWPVHVSRLQWGVLGPQLLTYLIKKHNLTGFAKPIDTFYPISYHNTDLLFDPALTWNDVTTSRTLGVHLGASLLKNRDIIHGSLLDRVINEGQ